MEPAERPDGPADEPAAEPADGAAAEPDDLLPCTARALLHRVSVAQADGRAPSIVAAVTRNGRQVWCGSRGTVGGRAPDAHTAYRIGSITKTFTAVLVMRLRDEGRLALTDPIERHVPGTGLGGATVGQLLAHLAGAVAEPPGPWWERTPGDLRPDLPAVLGPKPVVHPHGQRFHYSNPGYAVLGELIERLRGRAWAEALTAEILVPLGLAHTGPGPSARHARGWAVHPWADVLLPEPTQDYGRMAPAGQLWSTADDLCRFAAFLAAGDDRVLSRASVEEMRRPVAPPEGPDPNLHYGLGMQVAHRDGRALAGHTGSVPGFLASLWFCPDVGLAAAALTNTTAGIVVGDLVQDLVGIVAEREPRIPAQWRPASDPDPALLALTGPWYWGPVPFTLRVREGRTLELGSMVGSRGTRLRPEPDGTWTGLEGYFAGETLRVARDGQGTVTHLDLGTFVFVREPYDPGAPVPGGVDPDGWRSVADPPP